MREREGGQVGAFVYNLALICVMGKATLRDLTKSWPAFAEAFRLDEAYGKRLEALAVYSARRR